MKPPRVPLLEFPDVVIHAEELAVKKHPQFDAAKGGDINAADRLAQDLNYAGCVETLRSMLKEFPAELVSIHARETTGVNEIPVALAKLLARQLKLPCNNSIVQSNFVGHTGAGGFHRLAHQAYFDGDVTAGKQCILVDDFVGQGGTLANLVGFICSRGGKVLGATVLTGKPYSVKLAPDEAIIQALRSKHGQDFEKWWQQQFGFGFDCLTRSEARYLEKSPNADAIRDRLAEAGFTSCA